MRNKSFTYLYSPQRSQSLNWLEKTPTELQNGEMLPWLRQKIWWWCKSCGSNNTSPLSFCVIINCRRDCRSFLVSLQRLLKFCGRILEEVELEAWTIALTSRFLNSWVGNFKTTGGLFQHISLTVCTMTSQWESEQCLVFKNILLYCIILA